MWTYKYGYYPHASLKHSGVKGMKKGEHKFHKGNWCGCQSDNGSKKSTYIKRPLENMTEEGRKYIMTTERIVLNKPLINRNLGLKVVEDPSEETTKQVGRINDFVNRINKNYVGRCLYTYAETYKNKRQRDAVEALLRESELKLESNYRKTAIGKLRPHKDSLFESIGANTYNAIVEKNANWDPKKYPKYFETLNDVTRVQLRKNSEYSKQYKKYLTDESKYWKEHVEIHNRLLENYADRLADAFIADTKLSDVTSEGRIYIKEQLVGSNRLDPDWDPVYHSAL